MAVDINDLRLSLIWAEPNLTLLDEPAPANAPLVKLGRRFSYEPLFETILKSQFSGNSAQQLPLHVLIGAAKPLPILGVPWPKPSGQLFWQRYIDTASLDTVKGSKAWNALVPLRVRFPCEVETPSWIADLPKPMSLSVTFEGFFYPHGVALLANAVCRAKTAEASVPPKTFTLDDAVDFAFKIKQEKFKVSWEGEAGLFSHVKWDDKTDAELTLNEIAKKGLAALQTAAYGTSAASGSASILDPFTIFTVVKGLGADKSAPVDSAIQRALEGVTRWSETWRDDSLQPLDKWSIEIKTSPPSHVLYGRKRGRAVWFPGRFMQGGQKYPLACYHRNLIFASLQVESLCGFIASVADMIRDNQSISSNVGECARPAAGSLGRLYGGPDTTYRSMSPRIQIEQNNYAEDIKVVREFFGMGNALQ